MARSLEQLRALGGRVASDLEQARPDRERAVEAARRGFLQHELRPRGPKALARWPMLLAGTACVALVAAVLVLTVHRAPLTFEVNGTLGVTKTWLATPEAAPLQLAFSEGTTVRLEAASRARVSDIDAHGASLALEGGRLHAEVVHRADSTWKIVAGPFTINVTGTVFDVNWDPTAQQLAVSVSRGSVSVWDAGSGKQQAVRAPETLRAAAPEHRFVVTRSDANTEPLATALAPAASETAAEARERPTAEPSVPEAREGREAREAVGPSATADNGAEPPSSKAESVSNEWREFAKRGALREAFASAEAVGFARTCAVASASELLLLGDGARLSGKPERATEALLTLRRRYPSDPRRAAAAFSLGKVAFDQRGAYEQAAAWFSTSLREQPGGPLAREASGRLIEALRRADDAAGARRAARDYLDKYPEGPHADLARSVLR